MQIGGLTISCQNGSVLILADIVSILSVICGILITYLGYKGIYSNNEIKLLFKSTFILQAAIQLIGTSYFMSSII